ncbi:MAG TPA: ATP-binding protein [Burkholderiales bacterium]|nr:ATP-binding protein [Burkholderiales bacterium]
MSIRRTLLLALLGGLLVTGLVASGVTWLAVHQEADRLFDYHLRQMALSLRDEAPQGPVALLPELGHDYSIQMWTPEGVAFYVSGGAAALPEGPGGYDTVSVEGQDWRVFTLRRPERTIQVAAPMRLRRDQATSMALRILVPVLIAIPLYGVLIWFVVGKGLRPLVEMAGAIRRRAPTSLDPLPESKVPEVAPMTRELNALLERLRLALQTQRRFTADAAHELRSPLTALQMQLDLVERAATPQAAREAIAALRGAIRRAARLVDQLLTMARLDPDAAAETFVPVDLAAVAAAVAADHEPLAEAKRVELRLGELHPATVGGQPSALHALVRNLVDNAVRYTPPGGRVTVAVRGTTLEVEDTGPGIPAAERDRVLDRFYRVPGSGAEGSGLGLAIVRQVAQAHGAELSLSEGAGGRGLRVRLRFQSSP